MLACAAFHPLTAFATFGIVKNYTERSFTSYRNSHGTLPFRNHRVAESHLCSYDHRQQLHELCTLPMPLTALSPSSELCHKQGENRAQRPKLLRLRSFRLVLDVWCECRQQSYDRIPLLPYTFCQQRNCMWDKQIRMPSGHPVLSSSSIPFFVALRPTCPPVESDHRGADPHLRQNHCGPPYLR